MKKRLLGMVMACVLGMTMLVGCSSEETMTEENKTEESATEESGKETVSPASVEAPSIAAVEIVDKLPDKDLNFAFLCFQNNPFWQLVRNGSDIGAEYLSNFGVTVDYVVLGDVLDAETINAGIDAAILQGYDGICVTPFSPGTEVYIDKAVDAGIPVVTLYGESPIASKRTAFLGQDAYSAGEEAAKYVAEESPEAGKFAVITGQFTVENHEQRRAGFEDYLTNLGWENVGTYEAQDKADLTYNYAKDIMTANPDIKAIYMTAGGPFGAAQAAEELGNEEVLIVGHDEVPENLEYIQNGEMAVISQDTSGVAVNGLITLYNKVVANEDPAEDFMPSKSEIITIDNVADYQ